MRIYDLDEGILQAVQGSGIKLIIAVPNDNIQSIGSDPSAATQFVQRYVVPYASSIKYIAVGNEVAMDSPQAPLVGPAMQNVLNALNAANLGGEIKVSTAISTSLVINAYPPSNGMFSNMGFMGPVANFLASNGSPLLLNVYTYFAYADPANTGRISLDYALFTSPNPAFTDPNNGLQYYNLFDALVDATYAALSKATTVSMAISNAGSSSTRIVYPESGWPSGGGFSSMSTYYTNADGGATSDNARTYYSNLISHAKKGTPLKPEPMEIYLFELFDEDNKPGDVEKHFGLFYPNQQSKYQLNFN